MTVLQEDTVRQLHLKSGQTTFHVTGRTYITQEARDYIRDKKLTLVVDDAPAVNGDIRPAKEQLSGDYITPDGTYLSEKPEHMTHLHGNVLVPKTHPRITLRGKLDSLEGQIVALQVVTERAGESWVTAGLEELLQYCRNLLAAEVTEKPLPPMRLLGLDEGGLREHSHHPQAHYGVGHLLPSHQLGEIGAGLNLLRTASREVELAAAEAFCSPDGTAQRGDILQGLNRLSSACYILMLQWAAKTLRRNEESEHE